MTQNKPQSVFKPILHVDSIFRGNTIFQEKKFLFFSYDIFEIVSEINETSIRFKKCIITHDFTIDGKGPNIMKGYEFETILFNINSGHFELFYNANDENETGLGITIYFDKIEIIEFSYSY